jgi:hypothetical protein
VAVGLDVKERVLAVAGTAAVEAEETDVQAERIVDGVEALGAVFAVDGLRRGGRLQESMVDVLASHFDGGEGDVRGLRGCFAGT